MKNKTIIGAGAVVISTMALIGVGTGLRILIGTKEEEPREKQPTL